MLTSTKGYRLHWYRRFRAIGVAIALSITSVLGVTIVTSTNAGAASTSAVTASSGTTTPQTTPPPPGAPAGCPGGFFCSYNQGNGGDLCFTSRFSTNYPTGCANQNDGAYNQTSVYANLYWGPDYADAYYSLCNGCYLLYMTQNYFVNCPGGGTSCFGYDEAMGNNVASVKLT
jgi:hypothetical protein